MSGIYGIPETFTESPSEDSPPGIPEGRDTVPQRTHNRRPTQAVIEERDENVLTYVREHSGVSRTEIARALGLTPHQAYLSLNRLGAGLVFTKRVNNAYLWYPVPGSGV